MKFREEVSRGVSRGRKIHLKHPGRGSRLPPPISLPEAPPRQGSEDPLRSTYEKVLDELHPQSEWHRQIPQEAGKDTERMRV